MTGDPTEGALLVLAGKLGVGREAMERDWPRVAEVAFDATRRRMTTLHRGQARCGWRSRGRWRPWTRCSPRPTPRSPDWVLAGEINAKVLPATFNVPADAVQVEVRDGVARLSGRVPWHSTAEEIAERVRGVAGVVAVDNNVTWSPDNIAGAAATWRRPARGGGLVRRDYAVSARQAGWEPQGGRRPTPRRPPS